MIDRAALRAGGIHLLLDDDLRAVDDRALDAIVRRRAMVVVVAGSELRGLALAAALHSDWLALYDDASLVIDCPEAWSGVVWRMGARSLALRERLAAAEAVSLGVADALVPSGADPVKWLDGWMGGRSAAALESAAALIRMRGGDRLERAEFARLFAAGEPQRGLQAFLGKRRPDWKDRE